MTHCCILSEEEPWSLVSMAAWPTA